MPARTITEITEWGQRASTTVLEHSASAATCPDVDALRRMPHLPRLLAAFGGDVLDAATAGSAPLPAIAVDGKALSGSANRQQRHRTGA